MNKTALFTSLLMAVILLTPSAVVRAAEGDISIPQDAIGVSESDYNTLKNATCNVYEDTCGPLLDRMNGKIIFRAQGHGEMYRVSLTDGLGFVNRYLPDGIYSAGKKYYVVQDGIRIRVKKSNAATKIREQLGHPNSNFQLITPVGSAFMNQSFRTCDEVRGELGSRQDDEPFKTLVDQCDSGFADGTVNTSDFGGRMFIDLDDKGRVYYSRPNTFWQTAHEIPSNNLAAFKKIKRLATPVDPAVISEVIAIRFL